MLKVGTKVRIKEDIDLCSELHIVGGMLEYRGKECSIVQTCEKDEYYVLDLEKRYAWHISTFDVIEEPVKYNKVKHFKQISDELANLYKRKNGDYGDSFGESYTEFGAVAGLVRIGDKFNRIKQLLLAKDYEQQVQDEKISDTLKDLASYTIMLLIELENKGE